MKIYLGMILMCINFIAFGQEKPTYTVFWKQPNPNISLSSIKETPKTSKYKLQEVRLDIDLRRQALREETSGIQLSPNQFIISEYHVAIPQPQAKKSGFSISGNGYNTNNTRNNGKIKNTAYRDATFYTGAYCPITGYAY